MEYQGGTVSTRIADVWMGERRVVYIRFRPGEKHGINEAREVVDAHNALAAGASCPVLADLREVRVGADRAAREHYVSEESSRYKSGMAMLVDSPMQRMLGNIFFFINRPPYPTRMFSEQEEALTWLQALERVGR